MLINRRTALLAGMGVVATGSLPAQMGDCSVKGDRPAYMKLHLGHWQKRIMCAFNQGGACSIYPVRPIACRNAHAVETAAFLPMWPGPSPGPSAAHASIEAASAPALSPRIAPTDLRQVLRDAASGMRSCGRAGPARKWGSITRSG